MLEILLNQSFIAFLGCIIQTLTLASAANRQSLKFIRNVTDSRAIAIMTGLDLRQLLINKWGRSYDLQVRRTQGKIFVQVMWKYLEQASFPLSEGEYIEHLEQVAGYITAWGAIAQVQTYIEKTRERPRLGKAVSIPIDLGERASEWLLEDF